MYRIPLSSMVLVLAGCPGPDEPADRCPDRTDGALITLEVVDEEIHVWSTRDAFIEEALDVEGQSEEETRIPNFGDLRAGSLCDVDYDWHPDPQDMEWSDLTTEVCDGRPSLISSRLDEWLETVDQWCPWSARVVEVEDRRP